MFDARAVVRIKTEMRKFNPNHDELGQFSEGSNAANSDGLKIVEVKGDETTVYSNGASKREASVIVLDSKGKRFEAQIQVMGKKGDQQIDVRAYRGANRIGVFFAMTDLDGSEGQKGKMAVGAVKIKESERRKGIATALMKLGKRYNIGEETIYHSTVLTTAGAAFARNTKIEKTRIREQMRKVSFGGDRSEAGRYAANQRWQDHVKVVDTTVGIGYTDGMTNGMTDQERQLHELAVKTDTEIARLQEIGAGLRGNQDRILNNILRNYKYVLRPQEENESAWRYRDYVERAMFEQKTALSFGLRDPETNAETVAKIIANFQDQPAYPNGSMPIVEYMIKDMNEGLEQLAKNGQEINANNALLNPLNKTFAENAWSRFFLVTNTNGHIHKSMDCSTTRPTTRFAWITSLSGLKEKDAVEQEGEILCTDCFPSAPSEYKKLAKLLTPTGEDLVIRGDTYEAEDRRTGVMVPQQKTERLTTVFGGKAFLKDYHDFKRQAGREQDPERKARYTDGWDGLHSKENADLVAELVAQKTGKTVDEVMANAKKSAEKNPSYAFN